MLSPCLSVVVCVCVFKFFLFFWIFICTNWIWLLKKLHEVSIKLILHGWSPLLLTAGQLFPSLDSRAPPFNVLPWEERTPGRPSGLTLTSSVTWGKSLALANPEFPHLQPVVRSHSWNNKCMSTLKTQTCYGNANCYYTWSSFYELLKEIWLTCPPYSQPKQRARTSHCFMKSHSHSSAGFEFC